MHEFNYAIVLRIRLYPRYQHGSLGVVCFNCPLSTPSQSNLYITGFAYHLFDFRQPEISKFANLWPLDFDDIPNRSKTKMKLHILLKHK